MIILLIIIGFVLFSLNSIAQVWRNVFGGKAPEKKSEEPKPSEPQKPLNGRSFKTDLRDVKDVEFHKAEE